MGAKRWTGASLLLWGLLRLGTAWAIEARTLPADLVAGQQPTAYIELSGRIPKGKLKVAVNVGQVLAVRRAGELVQLSYRMPEGRYPRMVCIALWGDAPHSSAAAKDPAVRRARLGQAITVARVPLVGTTTIPIRANRTARIRVTVGKRSYGPISLRKGRSVRLPVVVSPAVATAEVSAVDQSGLKSIKTVNIQRRVDQPLTLLTIPPTRNGDATHAIVVALADKGFQPPALTINGDSVSLWPLSQGAWLALWRPSAAAEAATAPVEVVARSSGPAGKIFSQRAQLQPTVLPRAVAVQVTPTAPSDDKVQPAPKVRAPTTTPPRRRWQSTLGLAAGLQNNFGELISPRLSLDAGLEFRWRSWLVGPRLITALNWSKQTLDNSAQVSGVEASLLVFPISLGVSLRYDSLGLSPYALIAATAYVSRLALSGERIDKVVDYEVRPGFTLLGGLMRRVGPGRFFFQGGYHWGRIDEAQLRVFLGGLVVEGGYRFEL